MAIDAKQVQTKPDMSPMEPSPTPQPPQPSGMPKLVMGIVALATVGAVAYGVYLYSGRPVGTSVSTNVATTPVKTLSPMELRVLHAVTEAEYANAFTSASSVTALASNGYVNQGGVFVKLDGRAISVRLPGIIPNLVLASDKTEIQISDVTAADGTSMFDKKNTFETDSFFTSLDIKELSEPAYHFVGTRNIHLMNDVDSDDVARAEGRVVLSLPVGLSSVSLHETDMNKGKQGMGKIMLTAWEVVPPEQSEDATVTTTKVTVEYDGFQEKLKTISAFDADGKELRVYSGSRFDRQGLETDSYDTMFMGLAAEVKVFEADHTLTKAFPFTVQSVSLMPENLVQVSSSTQEEVIQAIQKQMQILGSKNPKQIRAYLNEWATAMGDEEKIAEVKKYTDQEIAELAEFLQSISIPGTPEEVRQVLLSAKTKWSWKSEDRVEVSYKDDQSGTLKITLQKLGGVWY